MASVVLKNVQKSFGKVDVIHGVDLQIEPNEFVVFVGPSGCGKSTLLRMISGLEKCDAGQILIGDQDVTDLPPSERGISMVFQSYALYPHMSVEENMSFGLLSNGEDKAKVKKLVKEAAHSLQLTEYLHRKPKALSGGQRQRVAIGRSIVRDPDVFLFDEPLSNLDAELRVHMRMEVAQLHKRIDATMIYVTHDQVEAMTLADKIVVLQAGRIEQVGVPLDLYDNPSNQFVAGFIGSPKMNFLPAKVMSQSRGLVSLQLFSNDETTLSIPINSTHLQVKQSVQLGVRPEHFEIANSDEYDFKLKCDVIEQMGEITVVHAKAADDTTIVIQVRNNRAICEGDEIFVSVLPKRAFVFSDSGERLS